MYVVRGGGPDQRGPLVAIINIGPVRLHLPHPRLQPHHCASHQQRTRQSVGGEVKCQLMSAPGDPTGLAAFYCEAQPQTDRGNDGGRNRSTKNAYQVTRTESTVGVFARQHQPRDSNGERRSPRQLTRKEWVWARRHTHQHSQQRGVHHLTRKR